MTHIKPKTGIAREFDDFLISKGIGLSRLSEEECEYILNFFKKYYSPTKEK